MLRIFVSCALLVLSACSTQESAELKAFADAFTEANQASEIEPMLAIYALEGTTENTKNLLKNALLYELGLPIQSIEFEPLTGSPEESIEYSHQGMDYVATLEPSLRMRVRYETEDRFESLFSIGQNDAGEWRIISSRPI
jgi:Tfp pilus assembly protein PilP